MSSMMIHTEVMKEMKEIQVRMILNQVRSLKNMLELEYEQAKPYQRVDCVMGDACLTLKEQIPKIQRMEKDLSNMLNLLFRNGA